MAHSAHTDPEQLKEVTESEETLSPKLDELAKLILKSSHMVFFTGAGVSTSAGIPDFRGPEGKWTLEATGAKRTKATVSRDKAFPTASHMSIVHLQKLGICKYLISQNTDGLHRRSGVSANMISELHGNGNIEICETCGHEYLRDFHCARLKPGKDHYTGRHCRVPTSDDKQCNGRLLNSTVDFGQNLPERPLQLAETHSLQSDLHIVLGSSLTVRPACNMPRTTARKGNGEKNLVIVNLQKTPLDELATIRIFAPTDVVMKGVMERLKLKIPKWRLKRYLRVEKSKGGKMLVSGMEIGTAGQKIPATVFKSVEVNKKSYREEPFVVDVGSVETVDEARVKLEFMKHYQEPDLELNVKLDEEQIYRLSYRPEKRSWKVERLDTDTLETLD